MAYVKGSNRADILSGTDYDDVIVAKGGNDTIIGSDGNDHINGGNGSDTVDYSAYTGALSVVLKGSVETDVLGNGAPGDVIVNIENLIGGGGSDYFVGDDASNTFRGNGGDDYFVASTGWDSYYGDSGYDTVDYSTTGMGIVIAAPKHGTSTMSGGGVVYDHLRSIENIIGSVFDDRIAGGKADNEFHGGDGNDWLKGGAGGDILSGQGGNDRLTGGKDADIFVFADAGGQDVITDFNAQGDNHDVIDFTGVGTIRSFDFMFGNHNIYQMGDDVVIDLLKGDQLTLKNVDIHDLSASDFLF